MKHNLWFLCSLQSTKLLIQIMQTSAQVKSQSSFDVTTQLTIHNNKNVSTTITNDKIAARTGILSLQ